MIHYLCANPSEPVVHMGFVKKLRRVLGSVRRGMRVDLAMDLGTANTLIYTRDEGIIVNEPSAVAIDTRSNRIVAVGTDAWEYLGRTPPWINAVRPLKDGVIADSDSAMAMIRGFLARVFRPRFRAHPRIVIGVPSGITQVEKRAVKDSAYQAGAKEIFLVEEPMAAAMGAGLDIERPTGNAVVDIGGGTTEVAVISLCSTAYCESVRVAGDEMDEAIVRFLYRTMRIEVTPAMAESIKRRIGCAIPTGPERRMEVTGKDVAGRGPRTIELSSLQLSEALAEPVDAILDAIRRALENTPPALLSDIKQRGIVLAGGGALLPGLDILIEQMIGIRALVADDPLTSVVHGCGAAMEDLRRWRRIFVA